MDHFAARCRANRPIEPAQPVRLPGDSAAKSLARARAEGIDYDAATRAALNQSARQHGVASPLET
jgi:LDH2 family malate/lactate/ureidoglycolate dehydrogenase